MNCSNYDTDNDRAEIEPTSDSNTDDKDFEVNVIPVHPFSCKTNNQYAELASFADGDDDNNYIRDYRYVTIPKPFLLTTTRTDA